MFVKPNTNPKYAKTIGDTGEPNPNHEPDRMGLKVYDPARKDFLPPEGRDVGNDNELHWARRLAHGEVTVLSAEDGAASVKAADEARALVAKDAAAKLAAEGEKNKAEGASAPAPAATKQAPAKAAAPAPDNK